MFYAVKVLQKKSILKKKEVPGLGLRHLLSCFLTPSLRWLLMMGPTLGIEAVQCRGLGVLLAIFQEGRLTTSPGGPAGDPVPASAFP